MYPLSVPLALCFINISCTLAYVHVSISHVRSYGRFDADFLWYMPGPRLHTIIFNLDCTILSCERLPSEIGKSMSVAMCNR